MIISELIEILTKWKSEYGDFQICRGRRGSRNVIDFYTKGIDIYSVGKPEKWYELNL